MCKFTSCIFTSAILVCVLLVLACSLYEPASSIVSAKLTVSSGNDSNFSRMIKDHNCVSSVDGLRLWIETISVRPGFEKDVIIWQSNETTGTMIDLRSEMDIATISSQVSLPITTINEIQIYFYDRYDLKAYTYLPSKSTYYYTSSSGVQSTTFFDSQNPPTDYGFYSYPFAFVNSDGIDSTRVVHDVVHYPETVTIAEGVIYGFEIYIDLINAVRFWDGDSSYRSEPFCAGISNIDDYFPENAPSFGLPYLSWCLVVYDTAVYSNPILETYLISHDTSFFDSPTLVSFDLGTLSFVFLSERSPAPIYGKIRGNFSILNLASSHQEWYSDFYSSGSNVFSFNSYSGEWFQYQYDTQYLLATYNNFPHLSVNEVDSFTISIEGDPTTTWYAKRIK